jgi:hypothetical protein
MTGRIQTLDKLDIKADDNVKSGMRKIDQQQTKEAEKDVLQFTNTIK